MNHYMIDFNFTGTGKILITTFSEDEAKRIFFDQTISRLLHESQHDQDIVITKIEKSEWKEKPYSRKRITITRPHI